MGLQREEWIHVFRKGKIPLFSITRRIRRGMRRSQRVFAGVQENEKQREMWQFCCMSCGTLRERLWNDSMGF